MKEGFCSFCLASTEDAQIFFTYGPTGLAWLMKKIYPKAILQRAEIIFNEDEIRDYLKFRNDELGLGEVKLFSNYRFVAMINDDIAAMLEMVERFKLPSKGMLQSRTLLN